jgi:hypothetical protein
MSNPEDVNPYQAPSPGLFSSRPPSYFSAQAEAGVTPKVVDMLAKTQPWVRFLSVLGFIGFALLLLLAFGMVMLAVSGGNSPGVLAAIYAVFGVLYLIPSIFLSRFASDIARLRSSLRVEDLEDALQSQKSFWKFAGIATLIMIVLYALILVLAVAAGFSIFDSVGGHASGPVRQPF